MGSGMCRGRVGLEVLYLVVLWYVGWVVVDVGTSNGLLSRGCSVVLSVLSSGLLISCSLRGRNCVRFGLARGALRIVLDVHSFWPPSTPHFAEARCESCSS